jgi:NAD-dependent deacetylase
MIATPDPSLIDRLRRARQLVVFTGAGMSAESGIPTFRDRLTGLWAHTDPTEVATPQAFRRDPQRVWDWHVHLASAVGAAQPNAGHRAIAELAGKRPRVSVVTQNIDGLHQAAGSREVIELHGNLFRLKPFVDEDALFAAAEPPVICRVCDGYAAWRDCDPWASREDLARLRLAAGPVPCCPGCGARLRPDVVWFNEMLEPQVLDAALGAVDACDAMLCIGCSLEVEPAASLPWRALRRGAAVIEINPQPTALTSQVTAFSGTAAQILPPLLAAVWG